MKLVGKVFLVETEHKPVGYERITVEKKPDGTYRVNITRGKGKAHEG